MQVNDSIQAIENHMPLTETARRAQTDLLALPLDELLRYWQRLNSGIQRLPFSMAPTKAESLQGLKYRSRLMGRPNLPRVLISSDNDKYPSSGKSPTTAAYSGTAIECSQNTTPDQANGIRGLSLC
jgi:hypothetical protein